MIRTATLLFGLAVTVPVHAADAVRRSSSDVLPSSLTSVPTIPMPPEAPIDFVVSISGKAAVASGAALDLRPVVNGASGRTSFLLFGRLPPDATFDAATGRIGGGDGDSRNHHRRDLKRENGTDPAPRPLCNRF